MARTRISTTVDDDLLNQARAINPDHKDSSMVEEALRLLLKRHHDEQIAAQYARAYANGNDAVDEWGDLNEFLDAAVASRSPEDVY